MAARKNRTPARIINYLRKAEVELANGKSVREIWGQKGRPLGGRCISG